MDKIFIGQIIGEIMNLGVRINYETDLCCFISLLGHVEVFEIRITPSKMDYTHHHEIYKKEFYYNKESATDKLIEIRSHLYGIIEKV